MTVVSTIYDNIKLSGDGGNWGNGGYGGSDPSIYTTETTKSIDWTTADVIIVQHWNVRERAKQVNDTYVDRTYFVPIYIQSKTSAAQLKLLEDEVDYLLRNESMTSLEFVNKTVDYSETDKSEGRHACLYTVEVISRMASGAITPAASTTGDFTIGGDLQVNGNDIKDSGGNIVLSFDGSGNIDAIGTISNTLDVGTSIQTAKFIADSTSSLTRDTTGSYLGLWSANTWNNGTALFLYDSATGFKVFYDGSAILNITSSGVVNPGSDKSQNMGVTGTTRWDTIYADDFTNESPYMKFDDALSELKKIKDKDKNGKKEIDYTSLPAWVRTTEYKYKEKSEIDSKTGEKVIIKEKYGEKDQLNQHGFSVNRMVVFLWQALQQALARIEVLESG